MLKYESHHYALVEDDDDVDDVRYVQYVASDLRSMRRFTSMRRERNGDEGPGGCGRESGTLGSIAVNIPSIISSVKSGIIFQP